MTKPSSLEQIAAQLKADQPAEALTGLLENWRATYRPELGELLEKFSKQHLSLIYGLPEAQGERAVRLTELAASASAWELGPVLAAFEVFAAGSQGKKVWPFVETLVELPPDPRIASTALRMVSVAGAVRDMTAKLWRRLLNCVERHGDERHAMAIEKLPPTVFWNADPVRLTNLAKKIRKNHPLGAAPLPEPLQVLKGLLGEAAAAVAPPPSSVSREQLLQAIADAPEDDGPRHLYADWLLERRDPRGEFIALQLGRASGTATKEARAREKELLTVHGREWGQLFRAAHHEVLKFERGFVSSVRLNVLPLPEDLEAQLVTEVLFGRPEYLVPRLKGLRSLKNVNLTQLAPLAAKGFLQKLIVLDAVSPGRGADQLAALQFTLPALRELELRPHGLLNCDSTQTLQLLRTPLLQTVADVTFANPCTLELELLDAVPPRLESLNVGLGYTYNRLAFAKKNGRWSNGSLTLEDWYLKDHCLKALGQIRALTGIGLDTFTVTAPEAARKILTTGISEALGFCREVEFKAKR